MVARKPLPENASVDPRVDPNTQPQRRLQDMRQDLWSATEPEPGADGPWGEPSPESEPSYDRPAGMAARPEVPDPLRPGNTGRYSDFEEEEENVWGKSDLPPPTPAAKMPVADLTGVPNSLRPGGGGLRPATNPFKRNTPNTSDDAIAVSQVPVGINVIPPTPALQPNSTGSSNNPWQPALDESRTGAVLPLASTVSDEDSGKEVWVADPSGDASRKASPGPGALASSFALVDLEDADEGTAGWDEVAAPQHPPNSGPPAPIGDTDERLLEDRHAWDDVGGRDKGKGPANAHVLPNLRTEQTGEGWNLIDNEPAAGQLSKQSTWENFMDADERGETAGAATKASKGPALPPRTSEEQPPPRQPPRPAGGDKAETYQIRNVNWFDAAAAENPRTSPILVQNANGPCPLLALVNALTLTTPAGMETALVDTLRSREQVSLDLLLDAVFDELMSPRRTFEDTQLPDVTELYRFLKGLHTGMNVNPRFIPTPEVVNAFKRTSLTHLHPSERGDMIPGTFEDTTEMRLYATFAIPLIHGWIPPASDAASEALKRRAESYEDVQNLLFREEELEEKLSNTSNHIGLTEEEQEIYQDILTIKSFLSTSATQLTPWGLEVISKAMRPGTVAILFRNDHFSTLYRHPQTLDLLGLVTDAGYAGHAEIVWESLVDVNGERSEFFSGDFRLVGGAHQMERYPPGQNSGGSLENDANWPQAGSSSGAHSGWTTVQGRKGDKKPSQSSVPPLSPSTEQEDRDLALALQLQEEEDERHRAAEARRLRESRLSEQFIEQQARQVGPINAASVNAGRGRGSPTVSQRRSSAVSVPVTASYDRNRPTSMRNPRGRGTGGPDIQVVRSLVPPLVPVPAPASAGRPAVRRPADDDEAEAPPSYEQASMQAPYTPPAGHPSHPTSTPDGRRDGSGPGPASVPPRRPSQPLPPARIGTGGSLRTPSSGAPPLSALGRGYRQGAPPPLGSTVGGRERECVVM